MKRILQFIFGILNVIKELFINNEIPLWIKVLAVVLVLALPGILTTLILKFWGAIVAVLKIASQYASRILLKVLKWLVQILCLPFTLLKMFKIGRAKEEAGNGKKER